MGTHFYLTKSFPPLTNLSPRRVGPRVRGEADPHVGGEEVLLEQLDLPVNLEVEEEEEDEGKKDEDDQVHPQDVDLG